MIHMYVLDLSLNSQDLWMSLYAYKSQCEPLEVNFTETALFQTKGHWAVTESEKKKWCKMPQDGSILTWIHTRT